MNDSKDKKGQSVDGKSTTANDENASKMDGKDADKKVIETPTKT